MKKTIKRWLLVICVIIAMCATVVVAAETSPLLKADNQSVEAGDSIVIPVLIQNNTGVMGMGIDIEYDANVFENPSITRGTVLAGGTFNDSITENTKGSFKVLWSDTSEISDNGTLFSISMNVKASAKAGDYSITISNREGDTFDERYENVSLADCVCTVSVNEKEVVVNRVLKSIAITKQPTKVLYEEGEFFDETGMVVTASYDDGSTQVVNEYVVNPTVLKGTDTVVAITYIENGIAASTTVAIQVKPSLSTDSKASSVKVNGYYGAIKYIDTESKTDAETGSEIDTDIYDVVVILPEEEEVTKDTIVVSAFDESSTVKVAEQDSEGNWIVTVCAQNINYASEYTIKITKTASSEEIAQGKNNAASAAINNHENAIEKWLAENVLLDDLSEETAAEKIAEYINTIPEVVAAGFVFDADDIGINQLEMPIDGDADEPSGKDGSIAFEAYIENGPNIIGSDLLIVSIPAKEYIGLTNLQIVQNCKKILDSRRVSLKETDAKTKEEISAYIAELFTSLLKEAGYSIDIKTTDIIVAEYIAPVEGNLDNPNGADGSISFSVQINSGDSVEITNEKTLNVDAEVAVIYNIAAVAGENGTISPAGNNSVLKGGEISFLITPAKGYKIDKVLVDQVSVGAVTTYKFTNVQASHTIMATFVKEGQASTAPTGCQHNYVFYKGSYFDGDVFTPDWVQYRCSKCKHVKTVYYRIEGVSVGENVTIGNMQYTVTSNATYKPTVKLVKVKNRKIKQLNVPDEIDYKGNKFNVTAMSDGICKNFIKLTKVTIGDNVKVIPKNAFYKCRKLKTVILGYDTAQINAQAFYGCSALKKVELGLNTRIIGKKAFYGCLKLSTINFMGVRTISDSAFMNCKSLIYLYLHDVKTIGKKAFYNCEKVIDVTITSKKLQSVGSQAFGNIDYNAEIYLQKSKFNKYKKLFKGKCPAGVTYHKY